jgi:arylsulfatase A-like enzyme
MRIPLTFVLNTLLLLSGLAEKKPNFLFIIVDDQSPQDLKIYNPRSILDTPNIDRLAKLGMVLDGAHHMGAWVGGVCTPSRHMVMSGRTVWHVPDKPGRIMNPHVTDPGRVPPGLAEYSLPAVFNRAGYDTMRTCKNGNSYEAANKLFTVRNDGTRRGGTDEKGSHWHGEQVMNYLMDREKSKDTDPFLIYYGFSHPHDVRDGKPELLKKYGAVNHLDPVNLPPTNPKQPPLPVNWLPEHPFDHGHTTVRDEVGVKGVWKKRDERTIRNEMGREFACSENIDIQIGRVLRKLEEMGELDNTYVIYTADHGMAIGRHGLQGKQNLYEHTWRIPFIVQGPGIEGGSRVPGNIYLLDVLATLCDLANIDSPKTSEGKSFKPVLMGKKKKVRDVLYGVYCGGGRPGSRCVKKGDWKLTQYEVTKTGVKHRQLFNLKENPHEFMKEHHNPKVVAMTGVKPTKKQVNLAGDPDFADKLKEMEALLLDEMRRLDDPYRFWNQPRDGLPTPILKEKSKKPSKKKSK